MEMSFTDEMNLIHIVDGQVLIKKLKVEKLPTKEDNSLGMKRNGDKLCEMRRTFRAYF